MSLNHCRIPLLRGGFAIIDDDDLAFVNARRWREWRPSGCSTSYAVSGGGNERLYLHRLLLDAPPRRQVDHINGNGLDNRRSNLRLVGASENAVNVKVNRRTNSSGFRGVCYHSGSGLWMARVQIQGTVHAKYAPSAEEAAVLYDEMAREFHGPLAFVNFK